MGIECVGCGWIDTGEGTIVEAIELHNVFHKGKKLSLSKIEMTLDLDERAFQFIGELVRDLDREQPLVH